MSLDTTVFQILKAIDWSYENNNFIYSETLNLENLNISNQRLELLIEELGDKNYTDSSISNTFSIVFCVPFLNAWSIFCLV